MQHVLRTIVITVAALLLAGCFGSKPNIAEYLARAQAFKAEGNLAKAKVELNGALARSPYNVDANLELAKIEDEQGDIEAAIPHYLVAAAPDARRLEPQLRIADILLDLNRFSDVSGRLNASLGAFPGNADVLALRADLAERQGQTAAAKADADAALQTDKTNARALAVEAALALRDKNATGALTLVDGGLALHPHDLRLLQVRAATLLTLDRPEQAADALKALIRVAPRNVAVQRTLANVEASAGHVDEAIANFKAAVEADPSNQALQLSFVDFLASQNRGSDVVASLRKLIDANPTSNTYDLVLAKYLENTDRVPEAASVLSQAADRLREGKAYQAVVVAGAKLDVAQGRIDLAAKRVDAVLKADPDSEDALQFRAALTMQAGRTEAAMADLLKVVRLNPVNPSAYQLLAAGYLRTGQLKPAVDAMQRAVAVAPGDVGAQLRLAAFLQQSGQAGASQGLMARLTAQHPNRPDVWQQDGQLAIARKDWAAVSRALGKLKDFPEASNAVLTLDAQSKAERGDLAGAATSFRNAIAADPDIDPSVFGAFARVSAALGQAGEAADFLAQHAARFKGTAQEQAWAAVMTLRADAGQFDRSADAFQHAVAAAPRDPELYKGYVNILLAQKNFQGARDVVERGLKAGAGSTDMQLLLGQIGEASGNLPAALKAYQDAFTADPLSLEAANNYGSLLADLQPKDLAALQNARDALKGVEESRNPNALDTIGWLDYRLGRMDEAYALLTRASAATSGNPQLRFHLAAVLLAKGDRTGGLALLKTTDGLSFSGSDEAKALSES